MLPAELLDRDFLDGGPANRAVSRLVHDLLSTFNAREVVPAGHENDLNVTQNA